MGHWRYSKIPWKESHRIHHIPKPRGWNVMNTVCKNYREESGEGVCPQFLLQKTEYANDRRTFGIIHKEGRHEGTVSEKHGKNDFTRFRSDNSIHFHNPLPVRNQINS